MTLIFLDPAKKQRQSTSVRWCMTAPEMAGSGGMHGEAGQTSAPGPLGVHVEMGVTWTVQPALVAIFSILCRCITPVPYHQDAGSWSHVKLCALLKAIME